MELPCSSMLSLHIYGWSYEWSRVGLPPSELGPELGRISGVERGSGLVWTRLILWISNLI